MHVVILCTLLICANVYFCPVYIHKNIKMQKTPQFINRIFDIGYTL